MPTHYQGTDSERRALDAYIKLQRAADTVLNRTSAHLYHHDLSISQFAVLEALYHLGTLSQRELAIKLLKSTGNMSVVLKNLEARGLISRKRDPQDQRVMQVCITGAGRVLLEAILPRHVAGIVAVMSALTADEQEQLGDLCRTLGLRQTELAQTAG